MTPEKVNSEPLNENQVRERYWSQQVKKCTDSRLKELVGNKQGSREELGAIVVQYLVKEEEWVRDSAKECRRAGKDTMGHAMMLQALGDELTRESYDEKQVRLKAEYDDDIKDWGHEYNTFRRECQRCSRVFYCESHSGRYCSYRCRNDSYIKRRKSRLEAIRNNKICLFCKRRFSARRTDAKYCSPNHRVRDFLKRKWGADADSS